ncbi:hypothetical protein ACFL60_04170 [Candidatus Omnitrophota bacterium]
MSESEKNSKNLSRQDKESFIKTLSSLAAVDGTFDEAEKEFLGNVATKWGINEEELNSIVNSKETMDISIPEDEGKRIEEFATLLRMMMVDGKIYDEEFQFCSTIAEKFGFNPDIVNDIVADIMKNS